MTFSKDCKISWKNFQGLEKCLRITVVFLSLFVSSCSSSQSREQQCADRYKILMENWCDELVAHASKFNTPEKPLVDEMRKTQSPEDARKLHQRIIEDMHAMGGIHAKYAGLLAGETPTETFQIPYAKTQKMFAVMGEGCVEYARLLKVGDSKLANKAFDAKMREAQKYTLELAQWIEPYDSRVANKLVAMAKDLEPIADSSVTNSANPIPHK